MNPTRNRLMQLTRISALLLTGATVHAGITTFTVTGTANSSALGYISDSGATVYTFTISTGNSFSIAGNTFSTFSPTVNQWYEEFITEDQLFTSITGSGLSGSFARPSASNDDPNCNIQTYKNLSGPGADGLFVFAAAEVSDIGIRTNAGASAVSIFRIDLFNAGTAFAYSGGYQEPMDVFQAANGTFAPPDGFTRTLSINTVSDGNVSFTIDSLTISTPPVPEPSIYAALAGLAGFGFAALRRRRA